MKENSTSFKLFAFFEEHVNLVHFTATVTLIAVAMSTNLGFFSKLICLIIPIIFLSMASHIKGAQMMEDIMHERIHRMIKAIEAKAKK